MYLVDKSTALVVVVVDVTDGETASTHTLLDF